jgi:hypothetical protein
MQSAQERLSHRRYSCKDILVNGNESYIEMESRGLYENYHKDQKNPSLYEFSSKPYYPPELPRRTTTPIINTSGTVLLIWLKQFW